MLKDKLFLIIFALVLFSQKFLIIKDSKLTFFSDEAVYASFARFWFEKDWARIIHPFWPPLYPLLSSIAYGIITDWEPALRLVTAIASAGLIFPVYILTKKSLGVLGTILIVLSVFSIPQIFELSVSPLSDMTAALFLLLGIVLIKSGLEEEKYKNFIFSGLFLGLAYLTRFEGLMLFTLSSLYLLIYVTFLLLTKKYYKRLLLGFCGFILVFSATVSPYVIPTSQKLGFISLSAKFNAQIQQGHAFQLINDTTWAQEVWSIKNPNHSSKYFKSSINYIIENLSYFKNQFFEKLKIWSKIFQSILPNWFFLICTTGFFISFLRRGTNLQSLFYLPFLLSLGIPITIFSTASLEIRYFIWIIVLGFYYFYSSLTFFISAPKRNLSLIFLFASFILTSPSNSLFLDSQKYSLEFTEKHYSPEVVAATVWLKENSTLKSPKIYSRHEGFEFYLNGETVYTPQGNINSFIDTAKKNKVDYIFAWKRELAGEELSKVTDESFSNKNLNRLFRASGKHGDLVIYEISK